LLLLIQVNSYLLFLNDVVKPGVIFVVCNIQRCRSCHLVQTITVKVKLCRFRGDDLSIHVSQSHNTMLKGSQ
jgi:hypothetical protein